MRILLTALNASYVHTNLAVRCIARTLRKAGHEASLLERTVKDRSREILAALYAANADVYGFSVYIWNRSAILSLAAQLRQLRPQARIVLGGPEISFENESFFAAHPYIDNILAGEGETVFPRYCASLPPRHTILCGEPYEDFFEEGILYDEFPPPQSVGGILYYESSRGCPYNCSYCLSSATSGVRAKSTETVIRQLAEFEKIPGVRVIKFVDRTFNFDRRRADAIWRALAGDNFTKTYHFEICADLLDEENFTVLASLPQGRIQLECGVQSTYAPTLAAIGRTADSEKILAALARIRRTGNIHIHADLIAGLPLEDFARFGESFDAVYPVCDLLQLGFLKILPGTRLAREAEARGIRFSPAPPYEILAGDALSFDELCRLHGISDVLERFAGSGHFRFTLEYLLAQESSPFAFYDALAAELPDIRALSQRAAYLALRNFSIRRGADADMLSCALTADWLIGEAGAPPHPLKIVSAPDAASLTADYCRRTGAAAAAVCALPLPDGSTAIIDRQARRVKRITIKMTGDTEK